MTTKLYQSLFILFSLFITPFVFGSEQQAAYEGAKNTVYPNWFKKSFLDLNEDVADAAQNDKRLMIIFHQDGCPYCNALIERNLAQKDIEQLIRKNFVVIALNMWGDREVVNIGSQMYSEKTFAEALKVQFTPTILFFNESGKVILRLNGYLPPNKFKVALNWVADKKENSISYRDYIAKFLVKTTTKNNKAKLISEVFFIKQPYNISKLINNKSKQPYAILFEQKDCPNCQTLHNKILSLKSTQQILSKFSLIQLDMWGTTKVIDKNGKETTAKQLAAKYKIKYAPTILVFNSQGIEIIRSEAFFKTFHTQGIFHYVSSNSYKKQNSFQRYLSNRAKSMVDSGINVDIWDYQGSSPIKP